MIRSERGQATVEFTLVLPVIVVLALGIVQLALVVRRDVLVHAAAREAARAASVDPDSASAIAAAQRVVPGAEVRVQRAGVGEPVRVEVIDRVVADVPVVSAFFPPVSLRAQAEMRAER